MQVLLVFAAVAAAAIVLRLAAGSMDHGRISDHIEQQGGRVLDIHWSPLGPGWWGEKSDRIYQVRYIDRDGNTHEAYCKTSLFSDVYFAQDTIIGSSPNHRASAPPRETLEQENRRLREELERLRRQQQR